MMVLDNIKVDQFFKLDNADKFGIYFNTLKERNLFRGVVMNPNELSYSDILVLRESLTDVSIESYFTIYKICYNQEPEEFLKGTILEFIQSNRYIINHLKQLAHRESQLLEHEPDPKWEAAGGERMSVFGGKATLIQLGEQFGKSPREIGDWKYSEVLMVMIYNNRLQSIMKLYNKAK